MKPITKSSSFSRCIDELQKLPLLFHGKRLLVPLERIIHIQADRNYSVIRSLDGQSWTSSKNLQLLDELLNPSNNFLRLNRSHLINVNLIDRYSYEDNTITVALVDKTEIPVARRYMKSVKSALRQLEQN